LCDVEKRLHFPYNNNCFSLQEANCNIRKHTTYDIRFYKLDILETILFHISSNIRIYDTLRNLYTVYHFFHAGLIQKKKKRSNK